MSKPVMTQFQPSLTEWFEKIGDQKEAEALRLEDNLRQNRLEILYQMIGLPCERPVSLPARELKEMSSTFKSILDHRGDELCAIRLVSTSNPALPKLRLRGSPLRRCYEDWFLKQDINVDEYTANIYPHTDSLEWSATFVVSDEAIFGEVVEGMHSQLTHGDTEHVIYQFRFDFKDWSWNAEFSEAERQVKRMLEVICVQDENLRQSLKETLKAEFVHGYLKGYFEATVWPGDRLFFIDFNRVLPTLIPTPPVFTSASSLNPESLLGSPTSPGVVRGRVMVVDETMLEQITMAEDSILVCDNTDVRYLPLMKQAAAFVTNRGSILSHASIVARELKKPCVVNTKNATEWLKTGDMVEVDADRGVIIRI